MSADLRTQLESTLGTSYQIERELGAGGFARVFLARETALDRRVVIKVLLPELAAGLSAKRFKREILLAASLQQANIVPVLTTGESEGLPLYTMPFVEGLSLRERLEREGKLPLNQAISILRDVARALAYAHDQGVVHRDIKPENVLLSGDAAVVTDFGIAKAIVAARGPDDVTTPRNSTLTQPGMAVGTPAYMAPEQIAGEPSVDHRADIYAFGCMAYELLAGETPFSGSFQTLLTGHLSGTPVPLGEKNPECPPSIARIVMQCLAKEPAARPQTTRELLPSLDTVAAPASGIVRLRQRMTKRQKQTALAVFVFVALGGGATLLRDRRSADNELAARATVAVLPFLNLSGDSAEEYLADGIADELTTALGKVPGVRVVSRGMSYRFKGQRAIDVKQVGHDLAARHLVQGSVRRVAGGIRVSANMSNAADNNEVWSDSYDGALGDALTFQDSITRSITLALRRRLTGDTSRAPASVAVRGATADPQAYDLYLRGRFLLQRRGPGVRQSLEKFQQAAARDSGFARAHAGLALALELLPYFEPVSATSVNDRAVAAAERALKIDSTLAEAHTALAMAHQHVFRWARADSSYRRAVRIDSTEADVHIQYGRFLFYTGRFAEAKRQFEQARAADPYSAVASGWVGHMLSLGGQTSEGIAELRRALEIDSTSPPLLAFVAEAHLVAGRIQESRLAAARLWRTLPQWRAVAAADLAYAGDPQRARDLIRTISSEHQMDPLGNMRLVILHLSIGDTSRALDALERATDLGEIWPLLYSMSERRFDPLRKSARFSTLLRRVGLDVGIFTSPNGGRPR